MRKAIEQIEPEHLDWQEYERAARINIKSLKIQLKTAEDMVRSARRMMDSLKDKSPDKGGPELIQEEAETCEQTKTEDDDTKKDATADI